MGWLAALVLAPFTAPFKGLVLLSGQIAKQIETELYDEDAVRQQLVELQLRYELGEIDVAEYDQQEAELLARLNEIARLREAEMD